MSDDRSSFQQEKEEEKEEDKKDEMKNESDDEEIDLTFLKGSVYSMPGFINGNIPVERALYKGKLHIPSKLKREVDSDGKVQFIQDEFKEIDYDSMDVYQKALPGQGFIEINREVVGEDGQTKYVTLLMPAFNKGDGLEEHRKHLQSLGIPYVESRVNILETIIRHGAEINSKDKKGMTALHYAASTGNADGLKILLKQGAEINSKDKNGQGLLHHAAKNKDPEVLRFALQKASLSINDKDRSGKTPLFIAIENDNLEAVRLLLEYQAPKLDEKSSSVSRLGLLAAKKHDSVNEFDLESSSPLHYVVKMKNLEIVELLLNHKANPDVINKKDETPLGIAVNGTDMDMVELLLKYNASLMGKTADESEPLLMESQRKLSQ